MILSEVEIIFGVTEDLIDGGYIAAAIGYGITTQADTLDQLRNMVKDAVECHFLDAEDRPKIVRLHFVRDEVFAL
jgi:predicted RNase H-like HicB family nuclease